MSYSTLDDFYRGMKLPAYDGKNIYEQMRSLHASGTMTGHMHDEYITTKTAKEVEDAGVDVTQAKTA